MDPNFIIPKTPQENQMTTNYNYISLQKKNYQQATTQKENYEKKPVKFLKAKKLVFNYLHFILDP
jgi:hypothetical protein